MFQMQFNKKFLRKKFVLNRTKNVTKETKNVQSENCFKLNRKSRVKVTKSSIYVLKAICGLVAVGPSKALSDLFCGLVLPFMILYALHGIVWHFMAFYGLYGFYISRS